MEGIKMGLSLARTSSKFPRYAKVNRKLETDLTPHIKPSGARATMQNLRQARLNLHPTARASMLNHKSRQIFQQGARRSFGEKEASAATCD